MTIDWTLVELVLYLIAVALFGVVVLIDDREQYTEDGEGDSE